MSTLSMIRGSRIHRDGALGAAPFSECADSLGNGVRLRAAESVPSVISCLTAWLRLSRAREAQCQGRDKRTIYQAIYESNEQAFGRPTAP